MSYLADTIPQPSNHSQVLYNAGTTQQIINSVNAEALQPTTNSDMRTVAQSLAANGLPQTCRNIYKFLKTLNYKEDPKGVQYIPTPSQVVHGRKQADCKGFAIITKGILSNLNIPYLRVFAAYPEAELDSNEQPTGRTLYNTDVTHVYTIVPTDDGKYICIDGTLPNYEEAPGAIMLKYYDDKSPNPVYEWRSPEYGSKPGSINGYNTIGQQPFYYPQRPSLLISEAKQWYGNYKNMVTGRPSLIGRWTPFKDIKQAIQDTKKYSLAENALHAKMAISPIFIAAREAIKQVLGANVLGYASILAYTKAKDAAAYAKVIKTWYTFGGDEGNLDIFIASGKDKSPRQVAPAILNKIPGIKNTILKANNIYYNHLAGIGFAGIDDATLATILTAATPIIIAIISDLQGSKVDQLNDFNFPDGSNTGTGGGGNDIPPQDSFIKRNIVPLGIAAGVGLILAVAV